MIIMKKYIKPTFEIVKLIVEERLATLSGTCVKVQGWGDTKHCSANTPSSS
jgi:hypothetical protein